MGRLCFSSYIELISSENVYRFRDELGRVVSTRVKLLFRLGDENRQEGLDVYWFMKRLRLSWARETVR